MKNLKGRVNKGDELSGLRLTCHPVQVARAELSKCQG